ncbi:unnamed protein product [Brachionus calyciflorus]|uniref:Uncharacterized protein n=1 Tax=Brachionus calyciflorus TaxID=104777 RepID=A0A813V3U2_9BILA|nr:unnamed protein product [Brachionus calyciflorus]
MMSSSVIDQTSSLSSQNILISSSNAPIVDFSVGSMPANYGYDESFSKEEDEDESNEETSQFKPRILIMGLRKSGKTSIKNVVFHKMEPTDTLFLDPTTKTNLEDISCCSFITFQVYDCSGQIDLFSDPTCDYNALLKGCGSLIFVIDAQDEDQYHDAITCLIQTVHKGYNINRSIKFEVFIHKVDGFPDEKKMEIYNEIQQRTSEMLVQQDGSDTMIQKIYLNYHLTSIYDHSIFEAFSKVVHKLIPQHRQLERLLDYLCNSCGLERAFLFDVASKIFIASDSLSPLDTQLYELCCDKIDLVLDISNIYAPNDIEGISSDDASYTCVKLNNELYLYMKQVNKFLAFVCVIRDEIFMENRGIMDYNLTLFKDSIKDILLAQQNMSLLANQTNLNQNINNTGSSGGQDLSQMANSLLGNI